MERAVSGFVTPGRPSGKVAGLSDREFVRLDVEDSIAQVTLDRPPVNALSIPLYRDIASAFGEIDQRTDEIHAAILTGAGRAFCAGRDLKVAGTEDPDERAKWVKAALGSIYHCAVPVVGAVNGAAVGAGLVSAISCDILVASENAFFVMPEIDAGGNPSIAALLRGLNQFQARGLAFLGERHTAEDFYRMGIVRAVLPPEELLPEARRLAGILAAKDPLTLRMAKWSANEVEALFSNFEQAYRAIESRVSAVTMKTDSAKEAAKNFADKRGPLANRQF
jgi:enoyl-CoA hydratase